MILRFKKLLLVLMCFTCFLACEKDKDDLIKDGNKDVVVKPVDGEEPVTPVKPVVPKLTNKKFVHQIVIERATGVLNPMCPRMLKAIDQLKKQSYGKNVNVVAFHNYRSGPFNNPSSKWLTSKLRVPGYPMAYLNRTSTWNESNYSQIQSSIKSSSPIGIKISSSGVSSSNAKVDVTFQFNQSYSGLSYHVYFLQNNCPYKQSGYRSNNGIYNHKNILLYISPKVTFENITKGQQVKKSSTLNYKMYKKDGETKAQTDAQIAGTDILVMVLDARGNVIQSAQTKANTTMEFQIKK